MLIWDPVNTCGQHWLKLPGVEVALVSDRNDPAWPWTVSVERQRGIESKLVGGRAKTLEHGRRWPSAGPERTCDDWRLM